MTDEIEQVFNDLQWHDAVLLGLTVDRGSPGERDEVLVSVEWPGGERQRIRFVGCYSLDARMNFGVIARESIFEAGCSGDSPMLSEVKQLWLAHGVRLDDLRYFEIVTNSTASVIRVCAHGFDIEALESPVV